MAPKKRKDRKAVRPRPPPKMSPNQSHTSQSARPSMDGAGSLLNSSDGPHTGMTSVADTEEELSDGSASVEADDEFETASIYPTSYFPHAPATLRSGVQLIPGDSRTATSDLGSSTRSLWTMDLDYREIHGRRYCREYYLPNDDLEQLRLTLQHQVFLHILEGELTLVPLQEPEHILDIGTGTGEWAIRMAELYPDCEVVGTDISAIAETRSVPVNVFFEIEDAEDWDRLPNHYDMIHMRWLAGAFHDWSFVYDNAYYSLKPGGWIEVLDFDTLDGISVFFHGFPSDSPIHALFRDAHIAMEKSGRPFNLKHLDPHIFIDAGFVDTRVTDYVLPIMFGERDIGKIWLMAFLDGLEATCLRLLTEYMNWDPDECKAACEQAARELANLARDPATARNLMVKLRVLVARKPVQPPSSTDCCQNHESPCPQHQEHATAGSGELQQETQEESGIDRPQSSQQTSANG